MSDGVETEERRSEAAGYVAFADADRLAVGTLADAAACARGAQEHRPEAAILVFDHETGRVVDLDLRGSMEDVRARYTALEPDSAPMRRGRPKIGVVSREVTLLPRHWEWLSRQPGGASTTLRKLVEAARIGEAGPASGISRERSEAAYNFMAAMAGDRPGFEEASRALFAGDVSRLIDLIQAWPRDIREEVVAFTRR